MQLIVFFAILLAGYVYVWRKGVLDWGRERE
jgi:NADH:ubiquinone oxidoreductase subunit 3 (subunit A)